MATFSHRLALMDEGKTIIYIFMWLEDYELGNMCMGKGEEGYWVAYLDCLYNYSCIAAGCSFCSLVQPLVVVEVARTLKTEVS